MRHELILLFNGGQVSLKQWKRAMPDSYLDREMKVIASNLFDEWEWSADGEAGMVIEPKGQDCLLMMVSNRRPLQVSEIFL